MEKQDIRETVSEAYTRALARSKGGGCCGPRPEAVAAQTAGYDAEREAFPAAAASSFGCGNPLAFAGVEAGQTVLDLGSGAGLDLLIAAEKVGPTGRVIGVDMTDAMIAAARKHAVEAGYAEIIEVRKGHIEALPVDDGSVDWVVSNCVINLSPDKPRVFSEIHRVLRPGGRFSVSDIVVESLPDWVRRHDAAYAACIAGAIAEAAYLGGLRQAGLVDVAVTDRLVYDRAQIEAMVAQDLSSLGLDPDLVRRGLAEIEGEVQSVKVVGRRPTAG
jgi:arsenite methyltransferase